MGRPWSAFHHLEAAKSQAAGMAGSLESNLPEHRIRRVATSWVLGGGLISGAGGTMNCEWIHCSKACEGSVGLCLERCRRGGGGELGESLEPKLWEV